MTEIPCSKCGKLIDSDLMKCPHCNPETGNKIRGPVRNWLGIILIMFGIIFIIIGVIGGALNTSLTIFMSGAIAGVVLLALGKIIKQLSEIQFLIKGGKTD